MLCDKTFLGGDATHNPDRDPMTDQQIAPDFNLTETMSFIGLAYSSMGEGLLTGTEMT